MKVIIPVAGIGARLRPHTHTDPKALLHVAGKPILGHILDRVKNLRISEAIFVIGFMGEDIKRYVRMNYKFKCSFVEQEELKGLGYAIYLACRKIKKDEPLLIILGDTIVESDLSRVVKSKYDALGVRKVEDPRRFGIVELKNGWAKKVIEKPDKPTSNLALVGIYYIKSVSLFKKCLEQVIGKDIKTKREYQLTDALELMIKKGVKFSVFNVKGWYDCGKPETLLETNRHLLSKAKTKPNLKGAILIPPVYVSRFARVCNSVIGPYVSIADDAFIKNSVIRNSIIGKKASVNSCLLDSSLVGTGAEVNGVFNRFNVGAWSEIG
ncbi:MAG: sugar phosphate nucleotidyltransferase [candidate division Zixibacteria bacterium]|nr:sugar phosphate nucleotidyltransferase [candidate division Zixibacteria bacterium]